MEAKISTGSELYREVVLERIAHARESVWISTANLKAMMVEIDGTYRPIVDLFSTLTSRGVDLRVLHAELPSRPFRKAFDRKRGLVRGGMTLKICPRVHFKCVLVDRAWVYLGSANMTGAGLGAKGDGKRNFELGFGTEDFDVIDRVVAMFESIWNGGECGECKLRRACPDPLGPMVRKGGDIQLGRSRRLMRAR